MDEDALLQEALKLSMKADETPGAPEEAKK